MSEVILPNVMSTRDLSLYYPKVHGKQLHPTVAQFFSLGNHRIAHRFCRLYPKANLDILLEMLHYCPKYFAWSGNLTG